MLIFQSFPSIVNNVFRVEAVFNIACIAISRPGEKDENCTYKLVSNDKQDTCACVEDECAMDNI